MMTADLAARVTWSGAATVAAMTAGAWWLAGTSAAAGVGGGGAIGLLNFRWLARDLGRATSLIAAGQGGVGRIGRIGLRQLVTFGALGVLIAQGWAHPVGVGVGLAALPPVLLAQGLLDARRQPPA
ncbi:MAG TPA: ATP synthase subunit I [Candidatus Nitrosotalea sp.]|nr:ATP synthase subunit I [Candidatus Nitrosotalea sp.]